MSSWTKSPLVCASFQLGKSFKLPFGLIRKVSNHLLKKIHCDLSGLAPNNSTEG